MKKLLTLILTFACLFADAQIKPFEGTKEHIGYLEYLPQGYDPTKLYPVIIFMSGSGEGGNSTFAELERLKKHGTPKFLSQGAQLPFIVLCPQQVKSKAGWYDTIIPFIKWSLKNYPIDSTLVFTTGLSQGGDGSWQSTYGSDNVPNYIRATAPISSQNGDYNLAKITEKNKVEVWVISGKSDNTANATMTERPIKGMRAQNPNTTARYQLIPGGHNSQTWDAVYDPANVISIYSWFASFKSLLPSEPVEPEPLPLIDLIIKFDPNTGKIRYFDWTGKEY